MSFQILNPQGEAISLEELDKEAAAFWNTDRNPGSYAHPDTPNHYTNSWYDAIGWAIYNPEKYAEGWNDVKCTIWVIQARYLYNKLHDPIQITREIKDIHIFLKPYYELIDHWESKGYIPHKPK